MLGFQYVVAKSRELSSVVERELSAASNRSTPSIPINSTLKTESSSRNDVSVASGAHEGSSHNEGQTFLCAQQNLQAQAVSNHQKLMHSGRELDSALSQARATLQAQAASEHFLAQNFHLVSKVREQLEGVRILILKLAEDADEVERQLVQRCEENAARQNAEFAAKQQLELEKFEMQIAQESESRKREILERKRQELHAAFMNDLQAYRTLMIHDGDTERTNTIEEEEQVTLDEVDLIVTADPDQLATFYESGSEHEQEETHGPTFLSPPVSKDSEEEAKDEIPDQVKAKEGASV